MLLLCVVFRTLEVIDWFIASRQNDRQTDRHIHRQTDTQTQTHTNKQRQTHKHRHTPFVPRDYIQAVDCKTITLL